MSDYFLFWNNRSTNVNTYWNNRSIIFIYYFFMTKGLPIYL